jgi:hypothetical protein
MKPVVRAITRARFCGLGAILGERTHVIMISSHWSAADFGASNSV